jgi:SAM-dependent methyltransferase
MEDSISGEGMSNIRRVFKYVVADVRKVGAMFRRLDREALAEHYLQGEGIEVGGLHNPLRVPRRAHVRYVDRMHIAELRKHYPELAKERLVEVDIIDDGETLSTIGENSLDFVIANHFIEHCENPLGTLENLMRVLKPGAVLYMCIPDKRYTFDIERPITPFAHIERDFREGSAWSRRSHYEEWVRLFEKVTDPAMVEKRTDELMRQGYSIHYHVWTVQEMIEMFHRGAHIARFPGEIDCLLKNEGEVIFIIRKMTQ